MRGYLFFLQDSNPTRARGSKVNSMERKEMNRFIILVTTYSALTHISD